MGKSTIWDSIWKWADRIDIACSVVRKVVVVVAMIAGAMVAVWSYLADVPGPVIAVLGVVMFGAVLWAWNAVIWMRTRYGISPTPKELPPQTDEEVLPGSWFVMNNDEDKYLALWTFRADGTVTVKACDHVGKGTWHLERTCVRITWESYIRNSQEHCWDTLLRPIKVTGIQGDSWAGSDRWRATKLHTA